MSMVALPPKADDEVILALIELLHRTDQQLDDLLGGEVDSVTALDGRTIVLRRAQGHLRNAENARQGAILGALPAHIALLDRRGVIVSVNDAWREFAGTHGLPGTAHALGANYLEACDESRGPACSKAHAVAAGIRSVLCTESSSFSIEYRCISPAEESWFQLTVTPLHGEPPNGVVVMHLDVTGRKQAADALEKLSRRTEQRERMLNTLLSSIHDFAFIFDRQARFLFANQPLLDLWARPLEDVVGRNFVDLGYPPDLAARLLAQIGQVVATGKVITDETAYTGASGEEGWYDYIFSPAFGTDGSVEFVAGTGRITTERKSAETALRASEAEFRTLASAMPQLVWVALPDGKNIYCNPRWTEYTGLTLELSQGDMWIEVFHPEDRPRALEAWAEAMATIAPYSVESRLRREDGTYRWWLVRGVPLLGADGAILKWIGTCTDIDDLKRAEIEITRSNRELQRQQTELRVLFDLMPVLIWFKDTENKILRVNKRVAQVIGRRVEDIEGKSSLEIYPDLSEQILLEDLEVVRSGVPMMGIVQAVKGPLGNEVWIERSKVPYRDETGKVIGIVSMAQDITDRKHDQDALRELNEELEVRVRARTAELDVARDQAEHANRAKSAFLAAMSHEIRTPMNGVIGMIEVLHQTSMQGYQVEMIDLIRDSAFALLRIIDDILDFSKIEAGKLELVVEPMDIAGTVEKVCGMLGHLTAKGNVQLTMFVDPAIPRTVMGDENRLRQVLINLIGNAIKFSGGRDAPGHVSMRVVVAGRVGDTIELELIVADDGIGMDEATLARLFTPFSQADASTTRRFGGSGLGLVISRMLAELMHGAISVKSVVDGGSTFTLRAPFIVAPDGADIEPRGLAKEQRAGTIVEPLGNLLTGEFSSHGPILDSPSHSPGEALRQDHLILIAEDNETNRVVVLKQLALLGFVAEVAVNGVDALERWRSGRFALLLTDLHMPKMDGYALARAIRSEEAPGQRTPIIAFTANALRDEELRCLAAGMDAYLSKPVRLAQLKASMETWLATPTNAPPPPGPRRDPIAATPPADLAVLIALVGDDPAVIDEVLQSFRDSAAQSSADVAEGVMSDSRQAVSAAAHRLKSAARSIGALRVGELCAEIEAASTKPTTAELRILLPLFEAELAAVLQFLDSRQVETVDSRSTP